MKNVSSLFVNAVMGVLTAGVLTVNLAAHEVTHKGTAVALKTATYAQPGGAAREVQELEVTVIDARTGKPVTRVFTITGKTRVIRDGKRIKPADAAVQKGEDVAVVVDHDKPGDEAIEVRLRSKT
jgi:hypothetical protein